MLMPACASATTFFVTTTADNGSNSAPTAGSLRAAIVHANNAAGAAGIDFSLPSCPSTFTISTNALPDITNDVTIDGYSQSGATQNTQHGAFDANLCVVLNGAGAFANGLHTSGGGRLTVEGLAFAGFTDAAIRFDAGAGNVATGNQIGVASLAQNKDGIRISGSASDAIIGSAAGLSVPGSMNLIGGNTGTAVYIDAAAGGSVIGGNVIGVGANGSAANGNNLGVYIFDSPNNDIVSNVVANNGTQGVLISGPSSTGNVVQDNFIGATYDEFAHAPNGTQGVLLSFGAANNVIGAFGNSITDGNTIYADGAAVWLSTSAGTGNRVLANQQMYSGTLGLPVDLGASGPTANDAGDADTGANNLQNYPVVLAAYRTTTSTGEWVEGTLDTAANGTYRLDFYWGNCCSGGRSQATYFTGAIATVTTDASGHAHFWAKLPSVVYPSDGEISATATSASGDTSESGTGAQEILGDMIFRDDFENH